MKNHIVGPNLFANISYFENPGNINSISDVNMFFDYSFDSTTGVYSIDNQFSLTDTKMVNLQCFYCSKPLFGLTAKSIIISNVTMNSMNSYTTTGASIYT